MKKLILTVTAIAGISVAGYAQSINFADNAGNSYDVTINGAPDTTQDINLELLEGASSSTVTTDVVTLLLGNSSAPSGTPVAAGGTYSAVNDVSFLGVINEASGSEFAVPAGTDFFEVLGWTGNYATLAAAQAGGAATGSSPIFNETITSGPTAFPGDISNVGVVSLVVPEPSTLAMAGVGLASMLIFRRKSK